MSFAANRFGILGDGDNLELSLSSSTKPSPDGVPEALMSVSVKVDSDHQGIKGSSAKKGVMGTDEKAIGEASSKESSKNQNMPKSIGHPALVLHPGGCQLSINVVFDTNLSSSSYFKKDGKTLIDTRILDSLTPLYNSIQKIILLVTFPSPGTSSNDQKAGHTWFLREMSKSINNFKGLNCLHIKYNMPVLDWDQFKTAAYFYRLEFQEWTLEQRVEDGAWVRVHLGSRSEKRLTGYATKLIEREQMKERAEQQCESAKRRFKKTPHDNV